MSRRIVQFAGDNAAAKQQVTFPEQASLREQVIAALRTVYDPEIPLNLYDLGLIYHIGIDSNGRVSIDMTLTTPHCPVAETMPGKVEAAVQGIKGVTGVEVKLVWDPPWDQDRMNDEARLLLGLF